MEDTPHKITTDYIRNIITGNYMFRCTFKSNHVFNLFQGIVDEELKLN